MDIILEICIASNNINHHGLAKHFYRYGTPDDILWLNKLDRFNDLKLFNDIQKWFFHVCHCNNIVLAKWIVDNFNIYIHDNNEEIFRCCCLDGNFELLKWLWELSKQSLDIHANNEEGFANVCCEDHLEIAQWLWEISGHSINFTHSDCLQYAKYKRGKVYEWLKTIVTPSMRYFLEQ